MLKMIKMLVFGVLRSDLNCPENCQKHLKTHFLKPFRSSVLLKKVPKNADRLGGRVVVSCCLSVSDNSEEYKTSLGSVIDVFYTR